MNADRSGIFEEAHSVINEKVRDHSIDFTRLLYMLSQDMDNLIRQADTKAQIILGVNAILAATGVASGTIAGHLLNESTSLLAKSATLLTLLMLFSLLASIFFALFTASPRVTGEKAPNAFFFGSIAKMSQADYVKFFQALTLQDVKTSVMMEIHAKRHIVEVKFKGAQRSVNFLFLAIVLWTLSRLLITLG
jgi:hypothetical protein